MKIDKKRLKAGLTKADAIRANVEETTDEALRRTSQGATWLAGRLWTLWAVGAVALAIAIGGVVAWWKWVNP